MSLAGYNPATVSAFASGTYRHVAFSISGTTHTLYLDGSAVAINTNAGNIFAEYTSAINNLYIGCAGDLSYGYTGIIDDFKIFNRALPPADISAIYLANAIITTPFTPNLISGIKLWLDAADSSTFTTTGTGVAGSSGTVTWRDKSGFTNNMVSNVSTYGAYLTTFTSKQVVLFPYNASNHYLVNSTLNIQTFPMTFFVVVSCTANTANAYNHLLTGFIFDTTYYGLHLSIDSARGITVSRIGTSTVDYTANSLPNTGTSLYLYTIQLNGSAANTSTLLVNTNGTLSISKAFSTTYSTTRGPIISSQAGSIYIAEMVYYQSLLNTIQMQQIEGYLAWKWGIQTVLPVAHPYYIQAPSAYSAEGPIDTLSTSAKTAMLGTGKQAGAYGVRVLYSGYTGPVIQIKNGTSGTPTDFYADAAGNLGTAFLGKGTSLATFLNSAVAYITKWYDQTGNGNDATGTLNNLTYNTSTKSVKFAGGYFTLPESAYPSGNSAYTFMLTPADYTTAVQSIFSGGANSILNQHRLDLNSGGKILYIAWYGDGTTDNNTNSISGVKIADSYNGTTNENRKLYYNNVAYTSITTTPVGGAGNPYNVRNQTTGSNFLGTGPVGTYNGTLQFFYWAPVELTINDITTLCNT